MPLWPRRVTILPQRGECIMQAVGGVRSYRVYAFTCEDPEARVRRHMAGLAIAYGGPGGLARGLRLGRKAAVRGGGGHEPARPAALVRLARSRPARPRDSAQTDRASRDQAP